MKCQETTAPAERRRLFRRDERGMTAVEFALIFPIMLALYWGAVDISQVLTADRKVTSMANTTADLIAQAETVDAAALADIYAAATEIMNPLPTTDLSIVVTSITIDDQGDPEVDWSDAHNGSQRTTPGGLDIPSGMIVDGGSIIVAEVSYLYDSIITKFVSQNFALEDSFFLRPRKVDKVVLE